MNRIFAYLNFPDFPALSIVEQGTSEQWMEINVQKMYLDRFFIYWKTFHEEILEYYLIPEKVKLKNVAYNELHLVEYSNLKSDVIGEVAKIVKFLGLPMTKFIEDCLMKNHDGFYKRSHNFSWKEYLIKMGKIDQDVVQQSLVAYNDYVKKLKQKIHTT